MAAINQVRTTTTVTWADAINNDANWTNAWTITEYVAVSVADLNLAYEGSRCSFKIEEINFTGTGTPPANANKLDSEILIALDSGFTNVISFDSGLYSEAKYATTKCIASFHPKHDLVVSDTDTLYITMRCGGSAALLADTCRITVSQY